MVLILLMLAFTVYSKYGIIPAMERDRIAAGGAIAPQERTNPAVSHFNKLHIRSEHVELVILLLGLATVVLVARAETSRV
jgi:hypothetical protein